MNTIEIGKWIAKKREEKKISQDWLAIQIGKSQSCIAKIENGTRGIDVFEFFQICRNLNNQFNNDLGSKSLWE